MAVVTTVGVDLDSRSLAISVVNPSSYAATRMTRIIAPDSIHERSAILRFLLVELEHHYDWFEDPTYIEAPVLAGARNVQSTIKIAEVYGLALCHVGLWTSVIEVPIASWKKETVGNGNASKEAVDDWLKANHFELWLQCGHDQNLVDATCIALYGAHHQKVGELLTGDLTA